MEDETDQSDDNDSFQNAKIAESNRIYPPKSIDIDRMVITG